LQSLQLINERNNLECLFLTGIFSIVSKAGAYRRVELNYRYLMLLVQFVKVFGTILHSIQLLNEHHKLECLFLAGIFSVVSKAGASPRVELNHRYIMLLVQCVEVPGTILHSLQLMNELNKLDCLFLAGIFSIVSKAGAYSRVKLNHRYLMLLV
jgi:uncharacterized MnhB-related membrane protein